MIGWVAALWSWVAHHPFLFALLSILVIVSIVVLLDVFGSDQP